MKNEHIRITRVGTFIVSLVCAYVFIGLASAQLEPKSDKGITYLSGGIGVDERDALRARAIDYNLRLSFAEKTGHYLSDVEVVIRDATGTTVLEAVSQGPWFFVKLPVGRYTVMATAIGKTYQQGASVRAAGQTQLNFYW